MSHRPPGGDVHSGARVRRQAEIADHSRDRGGRQQEAGQQQVPAHRHWHAAGHQGNPAQAVGLIVARRTYAGASAATGTDHVVLGNWALGDH